MFVSLLWTKEVMAVRLFHVENIVCNQFFYTDFVSVYSEGG